VNADARGDANHRGDRLGVLDDVDLLTQEPARVEIVNGGAREGLDQMPLDRGQTILAAEVPARCRWRWR
jgi:hypothetical protein